MKTLVLKSNFAMSAPLAGTPILPEFDPSLTFSYKLASLVSASGKVTKWANALGTYSTAADLTVLSANAPSPGTLGAVFSGPSVNYISTPVFPVALKIPAVTVLCRIKFSAGADVNPGTIFSGIESTSYAYLRRQSNGTITAGVQAVDTIASSAACPSGVWVDLAVVFNGTESRIYINDTVTNGTTGLVNLSGFRIGANVSGASLLNAEISHLQVYSRAITAAELAEIRAAL